jgi:hypothetical protein
VAESNNKSLYKEYLYGNGRNVVFLGFEISKNIHRDMDA